jgi:hypothetical protein
MRFTVSPGRAAPTVKTAGETLMAIAGGVVMVTVMLAVTVLSTIEVAVIVTGDAGAVAGASYKVEVRLFVTNVPHAPFTADPQDADQVTPALLLSFATTTE